MYNSGDIILSEEGITQGDPLAMLMYAIAMIPLIRRLLNNDVTQVWYADDACACGRLASLHNCGTSSVNLDQALAIFLMSQKLG